MSRSFVLNPRWAGPPRNCGQSVVPCNPSAQIPGNSRRDTTEDLEPETPPSQAASDASFNSGEYGWSGSLRTFQLTASTPGVESISATASAIHCAAFGSLSCSPSSPISIGRFGA